MADRWARFDTPKTVAGLLVSMVSVLALIGLAVIVGVHAVVAALVTRLLRVRLETPMGAIVLTLLVVPFVLVLSTLIVSGVLGLGPELGGPATALFVMVVVPLALGLTVDYVWMPAPDEVQLPESH